MEVSVNADPSPRRVVAVVDPIGSGGAFGAHARALGIDAVAVFTQQFHDPYLASTFNAADYAAIVDHQSVAATTSILRRHNVSAVVAAFQTSMAVGDLIAEQLGVPANPVATSDARSNKTAMKQAWTSKGIACASWHQATSSSEAASWAARNGLPVVVKPESSAGGFNVFVCNTLSEVEDAYRLISTVPQPFGPPTSTVLVEEFLDGDEYFVDLVHSADSPRPQVLCLARYDKIQRGKKASICRGFRSLRPDDPDLQPAIDYVIEANKAIDVRVGVNDTEFKLTSKGARVIEVNNRLPGALTPQMIHACTGVSPYGEAIAVLSGLSPNAPYTYHKNFAVCCLTNLRAGRVSEIVGLDDISRLASHHSSKIMVAPGQFAPETVDLFSAWGMVCLTHEDNDQLTIDIERVQGIAKLVTVEEPTHVQDAIGISEADS
jgi:biotin carboxylase